MTKTSKTTPNGKLKPTQLFNQIRLGTIKLLDEGKTKSEIFDQHIHTYGNTHAKRIARIISFTASSKVKNQHKKHTWSLSVLVILTSILFSYFYYSASPFDASKMSDYLKALLFVLLLFMLMDGLIKFRGNIFGTIMIFSLLIFIHLVLKSNVSEFQLTDYLLILIQFPVFGLAWITKKSAFPNLRFWGVRKSESGTYLFD